jgi:hypothetical protein
MLCLENLVNTTDFIELFDLLKMFESDTFEFYLEKLRSESEIGQMFTK